MQTPHENTKTMMHEKVKQQVKKAELEYGFNRKTIMFFMKMNFNYFRNRMNDSNKSVFKEADLTALNIAIKEHCEDILNDLETNK